MKESKWFGRFRISIATNGILYSTPKVQKFIKKNKNLLSIGISIDGTKEKHDLQRVYPNGKGSYDDVVKNIRLWKEQFPFANTKVTIGHDDLPYLAESIIHLWDIGINEVPANVVFEDVWQDGDDKIFEEQLKKLADYIIDNKLWETHNTTLFSDHIGSKLSEEDLTRNYCGTGKTYSVDSKGDIYPCVRYLPFSLCNKDSIKFGDIYNGIDKDKIRPFYVLNTKNQSNNKCLECHYNSGCAFCQAANYDFSSNNTNFERAVYICDMHKARCKANNYYWAKLYNLYGILRNSSKRSSTLYKQLYFLLEDNSIEYCNYENKDNTINNKLSDDKIIENLKYAKENIIQPIFLHSLDSFKRIFNSQNQELKEELLSTYVINIVEFNNDIEEKNNIIFVINSKNVHSLNRNIENCILIIEEDEIQNLCEIVSKVLKYTKRINIKIKYAKEFDLKLYEEQLNLLVNKLCDYLNNNKIKEINLITDKLFLKHMDNCFAGERNLTLCPDGELYVCPKFYYNNKKVDENIFPQLYLENAHICKKCDAYQCNRCVYENKMTTNEYNIPNSFQCRKSHIERKLSQKFLSKLKEKLMFNDIEIEDVNYQEPYELFENKI